MSADPTNYLAAAKEYYKRFEFEMTSAAALIGLLELGLSKVAAPQEPGVSARIQYPALIEELNAALAKLTEVQKSNDEAIAARYRAWSERDEAIRDRNQLAHRQTECALEVQRLKVEHARAIDQIQHERTVASSLKASLESIQRTEARYRAEVDRLNKLTDNLMQDVGAPRKYMSIRGELISAQHEIARLNRVIDGMKTLDRDTNALEREVANLKAALELVTKERNEAVRNASANGVSDLKGTIAFHQNRQHHAEAQLLEIQRIILPTIHDHCEPKPDEEAFRQPDEE